MRTGQRGVSDPGPRRGGARRGRRPQAEGQRREPDDRRDRPGPRGAAMEEEYADTPREHEDRHDSEAAGKWRHRGGDAHERFGHRARRRLAEAIERDREEPDHDGTKAVEPARWAMTPIVERNSRPRPEIRPPRDRPGPRRWHQD